MAKPDVVTLDLYFQDKTQAIASYLIRHGDGAILVESGPGSTLPSLEAGLSKLGLSTRDVTHVLLTHIHLDHAGAAGWFSQQGAKIYVHPNGAPHLLNPEKLIASATRIYGDEMQTLWGDFLPVAEDQLTVTQDGEEIVIGDLCILPLHTPGHAEHHCCYLFEDVCFTGDVGGVRIPGYQYMRAPMVPPELHFPKWLDTIARLRSLGFKRIAPTHYGIFEDVDWHLNTLQAILEETEKWLEETMSTDPSIEELRAKYEAWMGDQSRLLNLDAETVRAYTLANPLGMGADGMMRYWKKVRNPS
ncbi:MAG: MBL fold metallo-hydrolase [Chloroflexi bacterium]|nr:MBL fold metallo-hydrolase [Chloroflexota bacterium]